jgi:hypothetical protein
MYYVRSLHVYICRISPRLYAGEYDLSEKGRSWYLALEDLGDDYFMPDFQKGLTLDQVLFSLVHLA